MRALFVAATLALSVTNAVADTCKTQGAVDAKELVFDLKSADTLRGLHYAFRFGLMPAEFPASDIAAKAAPCSRGTIQATATEQLGFYGDDEDTPPRWSKPQDPNGPIIYLASMPRPDSAREWADAGQKSDNGSVDFKPDEMMVALVLQPRESKLRVVFAFFDKIPDDDRLKSLIQQIGTGKAHWQVGFDVETRKVAPNPK